MSPELDYMTVSEIGHFRRLSNSGLFSVYKTKICECEGCKKYIPKNKKYCSIECKQEEEGIENVEDDAEELY